MDRLCFYYRVLRACCMSLVLILGRLGGLQIARLLSPILLTSESFWLWWSQFKGFFVVVVLLWIRLSVSYQRTPHEPSPSSWRLYPLLPVKHFILLTFFISVWSTLSSCLGKAWSSGCGSFLFPRHTGIIVLFLTSKIIHRLVIQTILRYLFFF